MHLCELQDAPLLELSISIGSREAIDYRYVSLAS